MHKFKKQLIYVSEAGSKKRWPRAIPSRGRVGRGLYAMRLGKDCARGNALKGLLQITTFRSRETSESCDLLSDLLFAILGPTNKTYRYAHSVL